MDPPDHEEAGSAARVRDVECCTTGNGTSMRAALCAQFDGGRRFRTKNPLRRCRFF
jgi:hypothetical protein